MRRGLGLVVVVALLAGACGDGPDAVGGDPAGQGGGGVEVAEAAVGVLGDDVTAATGVVFALDRGYSLAQVVDAILGSQLEASGLIVVGDRAAAPDGPAFDVIMDKDSVGALVMVLALGPTSGGALTVAEFTGYLEGFQSWARTQVDEQRQRELEAAEEWARQEEEAAAAAAARQAERLERFETMWATFTILNLSDRGYSAEQIITAIVLGLVQCSEIPMLLEEFRCDIPGERPADAERGVLASAEPGSADSEAPLATTTTGPAVEEDPYEPFEGVYEAVPAPVLIEAFQQTMDEGEVTVVISGGEYTLSMRVVITSDHGRCTDVATTEYNASGVRFERGTYISFNGDLIRHGVLTCPDRGPESETVIREDMGATVWIDEDRDLSVHLPGGMGRDLPLPFVAAVE